MVEGAGQRGSHTFSSTAEEGPGQVGRCGESLAVETAARSLHKDKDISEKENCRPIPLRDINTKIFQKRLTN